MMAIRAFNNKTPVIATSAWVDESAVVIGDVILEKEVSIWPTCVLRGDLLGITIGARSNIQDGSVLHTTGKSPFYPDGFALCVENDVTIGHHATLHGAKIMQRTLIGMHAVVLDGAVVEPEVIVGAGSLVPPGKRLESGYLYVGSPVKQVRKLNQQERDYFDYSISHYIKLKQQHQENDKL